MSWLGSAIEFLNKNSGAITALATAVVALATGILAWITSRYAKTTDGILKATNRPQVILFLHYEKDTISLYIENIGAGYASDIEFKVDPSFKIRHLDDSTHKPLAELEPYRDGIDYLGSEHKIETFLCFIGDMESLQKRSFSIVVSYKDSTGTPMVPEQFDFELGDWRHATKNTSPRVDPHVKALQDIVKILDRKLKK